MSYKVEVQADSTGTWTSNGLRFATPEEAEIYARDLYMRWTQVTATRVVESADEVTNRIVDGVMEVVE